MSGPSRRRPTAGNTNNNFNQDENLEDLYYASLVSASAASAASAGAPGQAQQAPAQRRVGVNPSASLEDWRRQELMTAAMMEHHHQAAASARGAGSGPSGPLPPLVGSRAAAMSSFQDQMDAAAWTSSLYARMAHAQRTQFQVQNQQQQQQQQQHSFLDRQYQLQRQQAAAAEQAMAQQQQEEMEFNNLLLQKRQIDEMLLNSALHSRRFSMDSGRQSSIFNPAGAAAAAAATRPSFLGGQGQAGAVASMPMSMGAAAAMFGTGNSPSSAAVNPNFSNNQQPIVGADSGLLTGKIRGYDTVSPPSRVAGLWGADPSRRFSDPQHNRLLGASSSLLPSSMTAAAAAGQGGAGPFGSGSGAMEEGGFQREEEKEEDDETYFNDTGIDEVDRDFKRSQENFPLKLYRIIWEVVKSGRGDVISFFPHGRAFAVHKPKEFVNEIMPKYFATGRMNTFLKQLNLYGFKRITDGKDRGGYFHPRFIFGQRHLARTIKRKKTDSKPKAATSSKAKSFAEAKEADRQASPISAEQYARTLMRKDRKTAAASKKEKATLSPPVRSPSSSPSS